MTHFWLSIGSPCWARSVVLGLSAPSQLERGGKQLVLLGLHDRTFGTSSLCLNPRP
jgi:hypothetical protein